MSSMRRCWNAQRKQWEACKTVTLASRGGGGTGTVPQCCLKPTCCLTCNDLKSMGACLANVPLILGFVQPTPVTPDVTLIGSYLDFVSCILTINRGTDVLSTADYTNYPVVVYTDVPCYATPVIATNVGVNAYNIWVRQCLVLTSTDPECPDIGVCFETTALDVPGQPGDYYHQFRNPVICLNPLDFSAGSNCDNCLQQPPTP